MQRGAHESAAKACDASFLRCPIPLSDLFMRSRFSIVRCGRRPLAVALAVLMLGFVAFSAAAWRYNAVLVREAQERTSRLSFLLSEQAARTFEAVDFTLRGFEPLLADGPLDPSPQLGELLRRRASELSFVQTIRVLDLQGRVILSSDPGARGKGDPGCLAALSPPQAPGLAIGCTAGDMSPEGLAAIAVARRLSDSSGRFRGAIVADIDPGYFSRFFADLDLGRHALVTLNENHGRMLLASTRPPGEDDSLARPRLVPPTERARLGELQRTSRNQITAVHAAEGYPVSVLVGIDRSDVERRWRQAMLPTSGLALAAGALLLALAFTLERHRAERVRASQRAAMAQKLEAIGQMTASVAHDFRNVLTALQGSLRLLRKRGPDEAVFDEAAAALARGRAMVDRLLAFSRRQELQLEVHDVNALITALDGTLHHVAGADTRVTLELAAGLPLCRLDRVQFDAALMNLVVNARQAMPGGGAIKITSRAAEGAAPGVEVSVRDTGCGIDAVTLKRVFEPFFTTKAQTGTGLGLAQVQGFMQEIGGRVAIDSAVGVGTTVSLFLPGLPDAQASREPVLMRLDPV